MRSVIIFVWMLDLWSCQNLLLLLEGSKPWFFFCVEKKNANINPFFYKNSIAKKKKAFYWIFDYQFHLIKCLKIIYEVDIFNFIFYSNHYNLFILHHNVHFSLTIKKRNETKKSFIESDIKVNWYFIVFECINLIVGKTTMFSIVYWSLSSFFFSFDIHKLEWKKTKRRFF